MKTMTCKQLGGACNLAFHASTFEEMASQSQQHGKEMMEQQEPGHLAAMGTMMEMMKDPSAMNAWMDSKKAEFERLPEA
jgi:hypothetical protein